MSERADPEAVSLRHVDFLVLAVVAEGPLHGYGVVQAVDAATGGRVSMRPGDVYRVLYRLQRRGLLEPVDAAGASATAPHDRRTYYAITELGGRVVRAEAELLAGISRRLLARAPRGLA